MDPKLRHLVASVLVRQEAYEVANCRRELLQVLGSKNYVNLICFALYEERGPIDIGSLIELLNITPIQAAIFYLALVKGSQNKDQRQMALMLLTRKLGEIGTSIVGKDFNSVSSNSMSQSRIGKVGIKNDPVVPESTMLDLVMWSSSAQDISEVHLFLSANALMSLQEESRASGGSGSGSVAGGNTGSGTGAIANNSNGKNGGAAAAGSIGIGGSASSNGGNNNGNANAVQSSQPTQFSIMASVLSEIGGACTVSQDAFVSLLKHICTNQRMHFNEEWIARLLVEAVSVWTKPESGTGVWPKSPQAIKLLKSFLAAADENIKKVFDFQSVMQAPTPDRPTPTQSPRSAWSIDIALAAIKQCVKVLVPRGQEIKWQRVAELLDDSRLRLLSNTDGENLARMYYRLCDNNFPTSILANKLWSNTTAQFALVAWISALSSSNSVHVDVGPFIRNCCERVVEANDTVFQTLWPSITLYATLLKISSRSPNLFAKVLQLILSKSKYYPEYIAVCLAQLNDTTEYSVRSEVLYQVLPLFTGLEGSLPTSSTIWNIFASKNVDLLELLFRLTVKHAQTGQEVLDAIAKLKSVNEASFQKVEKSDGHTGALDDLLSYWCVKADKQSFNLEKFIAATLQENPKAAGGVFQYIQNRLNKLRLRATFDGGVLSFESCAALLQALQQHIPMDKLRRVMHVLQQGFQSAQQSVKEGRKPIANSAVGASSSATNGPHVQNITTNLSQLPGPGSDSGNGSSSRSGSESLSTSTSLTGTIANNHSALTGATAPSSGIGSSSSNVNGNTNTNANANNSSSSVSSQGPGEESFEAFVKRGPTAEVSAAATQYLKQTFTGATTIQDTLKHMQHYRDSENRIDREIFYCMILSLFDEYRFFPKYQKKELQISGLLFGNFISTSLLSGKSLTITLKLVLEALVKDPFADTAGVSNEGIFQFGVLALGCFRSKLNEYPQFAADLIRVPHFQRECPDLFADVQRTLGIISSNPNMHSMPSRSTSMPSMQTVLQQAQQGQGLKAPHNQLPQSGSQSANARITQVNAPFPSATAEKDIPVPLPLQRSASDGSGSLRPDPVVSSSTLRPENNLVSKYTKLIDQMVIVNVDNYTKNSPSDTTYDKIHFIFNNISQQTCEARSLELAQMLTVDNIPWFGSYIIEKRVSAQPNFHSLYISIMNYIGSPSLDKQVLNSTYYNITRLLQSPTITTSSSERSVLRNLGMWLGQITLARNKPILQRRINLKELLFWGFETGRLIAVCSFVVKIVEGIRDSTIFRPPNPWVMALLGVLRDLYETDDLKMNIKFEVQVLCKSVNIRIEDIPRTSVLCNLNAPVKDGKNPDFNIATRGGSGSSGYTVGGVGVGGTSPIPSSSPPLKAAISSLTSQGMPLGSDTDGIALNNTRFAHVSMPDSALLPERTVIPNLENYITVNPALLNIGPSAIFRRIFCQALDKAIVETVQTAVEKSVGIVSVTIKMMVLKDFAHEPSEAALRRAAHLAVSGLASSLVIVSCREPLRIGIANHLRALLTPRIQNEEAIEKIVKICAVDNVELGCTLIEKATREKAIQVIDNKLADSYQIRQKYNAETDGPFIDPAFIANDVACKYPTALPANLKQLGISLNSEQQAVYSGFSTSIKANSTRIGGTEASNSGSDGGVSGKNITDRQGQDGGVGMGTSQAMEAYASILERLESSIQKTLNQGQNTGTVVTLSMLSNDSEIVILIREIGHLAQRVSAAFRFDTATLLTEVVLRRMFESSVPPSVLRLESLVSILEVLRDTLSSATKVVPCVGAWLASLPHVPLDEDIIRKAHRTRLLLLLRSKLLLAKDLDLHFKQNMDIVERNLLWVETALSIVRQCIVDGMASAQDFVNTFDVVSRMRPPNAAVRKQLQKWLHDLQNLVASQTSPSNSDITTSSGGVGGTSPYSSHSPNTGSMNSNSTDNFTVPGSVKVESAVREHITVLLERWLRVWKTANDHIFSQYLQLMHQYGVLKTEDNANRFFRLATELCVEACVKSARPIEVADGSTTLNFTVMDALSKLFLFLLHLAVDKDANDERRQNLLNRILVAISRVLIDDHDDKKSNKKIFDQRPYVRLLSGLMQDLGQSDPTTHGPNHNAIPLLSVYYQLFMLLTPATVPGFAFGWLQLVSSKHFMPQLLQVQGDKGWPYMHRLLLSLLMFLLRFLKTAQMTDAARKLYKGTLRVLLVLVHDFPEFLCYYQMSLCDVIPPTCVQLRNLILSAFPRTMRLPDPFTPNLKVDTLPEIRLPPRMFDYAGSLGGVVRQKIDQYLLTKQPTELPTLIPQMLVMQSTIAEDSPEFNIPIINLLTTYLGEKGVERLHIAKVPSEYVEAAIKDSPSWAIFTQLVTSLDAQGRYHLFNAMANQLRYPNSSTHYFSTVLLLMFADASDEYLQEQITRVLLERLIVHRPHPWGLLVTFIELIKNPLYSFWARGFTKFAPEIKKVFESVARLCLGAAKGEAAAGGNGSGGESPTLTSTTPGASSASATATVAPVHVHVPTPAVASSHGNGGGGYQGNKNSNRKH